jgi:membrane protein implicated in regulation of membrane protease activity
LGALVVGLGILLSQVIMGGHHDGSGGNGDHQKELGAPVADDAVALFLSSRFWIFFALAFGLSGSLMNVFALATPIIIGFTATFAGVASGVFSTMMFRALSRTAVHTPAEASEAVGRTGRVVVACAKGRVGQVRIALKGQSVDLLATTDEEAIERGSDVLVEDVRGEIAHVSPRPKELA